MCAADARWRELLGGARVLPVYTPESVTQAVAVADALGRAGCRALELTLRHACAFDALEAMCRAQPKLAVGVGTVLDADSLRRAHMLGAAFAVSPGSTAELMTCARELDLPYLPGVATASELMQAQAAGYTHVKCFPAAASGGVALLRAWAGPFPEVRICPTGGIDADNAPEYLGLANVFCVGGSWITPRAALVAGDWAQIEQLARQALTLGR